MSPRRALAAIAGLVAIFAAMLVVIWPPGHLVEPDLAIASWMAAHRGTVGMAWFITCAALGSTPVLVALACLAAVYAWRRGRGLRDAPWIALACAGSTGVYRLINELVARPRPAPPMRVFAESTWSFPSGHATQSTAYWLTAAAIFAAGRSRPAQRAVFAVAGGCIAVIGASRIYLCAHWTTDVIAGFALGGAWWFAVMAIRARVTA